MCKRLMTELQQLKSNPSIYYDLSPIDPNNLQGVWSGYVLGPQNTNYAGGRFMIQIDLAQKYPFKPPMVRMLTPLFHNNDFNILCCTDYGTQWAPTRRLHVVINRIRQYLRNPYVGHYDHQEKSQCEEEYNTLAKIWTRDYAD